MCSSDLEYDRPARRIVIHPEPVAPPRPAHGRLPEALAVVAMFRDNADSLPHTLSRFAAWETAGLPIRYYFLENDSVDATPTLLADFMRGRYGTTKPLQDILTRLEAGARGPDARDSEPTWLDIFRSHPVTADRVAALKALDAR